MEWLRSKSGRVAITAHRGAAAYVPENTMVAFRLARELGADAVELDVHMTSDDRLVVHHDDTLDRTTNGSGLHVFGFGVGEDLTRVMELDAMLANETDFVSSGAPDRLREFVEGWLVRSQHC